MGKFLNAYEVYVGTYKKYSEHNLDGDWLDLCVYDDCGEFLEACKELHEDENDPEFMIQSTSTPIDIFAGEPTLADIRNFYDAKDLTESSANEHDLDIDDLLYMYYTEPGFREDDIYAYGDDNFDDAIDPNLPNAMMESCFDYDKWREICASEYTTYDLPSGETLYTCN